MLDKILEEAPLKFEKTHQSENIVVLEDIPGIADLFFYTGVTSVSVSAHGLMISTYLPPERDQFVQLLIDCVGVDWDQLAIEVTVTTHEGGCFSACLRGRSSDLWGGDFLI
jgi:hypothetical protein